MTEFSERWLNRLMAVIAGLNWLFLILGSIAGLIQYPKTAWPAMVLSGIYVVGFQLLPRRLILKPVWREGSAIIATSLTAGSMALTGSFESTFLLLAVTPVMLAALMGGYRLGSATAGLSAGILVAIEVSRQSLSYGATVSWIGLLLLVAATFGLARRLILEAMDRVEALTEMTAETGARLEQLENTNVLLVRLVGLTENEDLSATTIGTAALATIRSAVPFNGAEIYMITGGVPTLVAEAGARIGGHEAVPISTSQRPIGDLRLFLDRPLTARQQEVVTELLAPTAISFANVALLEQIAAEAIRDERLRVARELHDGIGPGLAALGLAMDVTAMGARGALEQQLIALRASVTNLVTDVRIAVEDLRDETSQSTLTEIRRLVVGASPPVKIAITELKPIPDTRRSNITAIAIEAIRNAMTHSPGSQVVVSGIIEGDSGQLRIQDDGVGFDPNTTHDGHFGMVGMRERAAAADATIRIDSSAATGTAVVIEWEPR
jgi:signal transduction histidine kinase